MRSKFNSILLTEGSYGDWLDKYDDCNIACTLCEIGLSFTRDNLSTYLIIN